MTSGEKLDERFDRERKFHDQKYTGSELYPAHYKLSPTVHVYNKMREVMGDIKGKRILEIGCGTGWITCDLALAGADVVACDISPEAVNQTREALERHGVNGACSVKVVAIEELTEKPESFDLAIGFAILHHLDLDIAIGAIKPVLKKGGRLVAAEPLGHNPLLNLYRRRTPQFRSPDERPLDIDGFSRAYEQDWQVSHKEYFLTALAPLTLAYAPGGARMYGKISPAFHRFDEWLLRVSPRLGKFAWYTILEMRSRLR